MAGSNTRSLCQKLVLLIRYLRPPFSFMVSYIFRLQGWGSSSLNTNGKKLNFVETEPGFTPEHKSQRDLTEIRDFVNDAEEEEKPEAYLKFKFPTYEEFCQIQKGTGNIFNSEVVPSASTGKCDFASGRSSISTFIDNSDELEIFPVKEINATTRIGNFSENEEGFSDINFGEVDAETGGVHEKGNEILVFDKVEKVSEEKAQVFDKEEKSEEKAQIAEEEEGLQENHEFVSEKTYVITDSDSDSTSFKHINSLMNRLVDSYSDGFLSEGDFGESEEMESEDFGDEDGDVMEELKKLEEHNHQNPDEFLCDNDFDRDLDNINDAEFDKGVIGGDNSDKQRSKDSSLMDSGDPTKLESLWEHQELIEQLRTELKKVQATGLPTILEESESPKIMDDLKPWRIEEFQREDCMGELHRFYKSYRERMRKFDIINYQKMYAMGFLQLKDPLKSISKQRTLPPTFKSLVSQNLWLFKNRIHSSNPMKKFIKELQGDLEAVYIGQMCLSWEFLHWQYEKALDLWDSDPRGIRRYNEVAGEFQQFQVLMQRFIEDERFQGPRVQNYIQSRCLVRNLLQVPVIREDKSKDQRKARRKDTDEYVITSDMLVEIVEESIRIFWRFVRADKDCTIPAIHGHKKMPEFSSPEDLKLLVEVRKILQKKEKKLKDLLRSENCILRKFRRCRDDDSDQVLCFFSQVDMKLVSRVLNMSKVTRDQLIWCHNKLSRISFVNRRIDVEPAFLLFPC